MVEPPSEDAERQNELVGSAFGGGVGVEDELLAVTPLFVLSSMDDDSIFCHAS